ncbi:MAG: hypothetical protein JW779_06220 [Candidatus Thorarchaeota archaeon]|nr:hypothetical protein [Candidatus Thorarchaeota archaeon]
MSFDDERIEDEEIQQAVDWRHYGDHDQSTSPDLEGKDILAIFIASIQTIFLPLVILAIFMFVIGILFGTFF